VNIGNLMGSWFSTNNASFQVGRKATKDDGIVEGSGACLSGTIRGQGKSVTEFLRSLKTGKSDLPESVKDQIDETISNFTTFASSVMENWGLDIKVPVTVKGTLTLHVSVGVTATIKLGWADSEGYYMLGASANVSGSSVGFFAGINPKTRGVKIKVDFSNASIEATVEGLSLTSDQLAQAQWGLSESNRRGITALRTAGASEAAMVSTIVFTAIWKRINPGYSEDSPEFKQERDKYLKLGGNGKVTIFQKNQRRV